MIANRLHPIIIPETPDSSKVIENRGTPGVFQEALSKIMIANGPHSIITPETPDSSMVIRLPKINPQPSATEVHYTKPTPVEMQHTRPPPEELAEPETTDEDAPQENIQKPR